MPYSLPDFAASLDLDRCKIQNTPDLLFLCGGPLGSGTQNCSARDFFRRYVKMKKPEISKRIRLAESISAWFHRDDAFPDLLELEAYLAHLAGLTVLFVESPGSIAELGAFAASDQIRPSTFAVLNEIHGFENSFIADGPVRKLKNDNEKHVTYYNWDPSALNSATTLRVFREIAGDLITFIERRDAVLPRQVDFRKERTRDRILFAAELIRVSGVASRSDVSDCLKAVELETQPTELKRYISILQSVDMIECRKRASDTFYVSRYPQPLLRCAYRKDAALRDAERIKVALRQSLDARRTAVLRSSLRARNSNV